MRAATATPRRPEVDIVNGLSGGVALDAQGFFGDKVRWTPSGIFVAQLQDYNVRKCNKMKKTREE